MSKNDKDKIRLLILGIIIIGFGYYKYVYSPQLAEIVEKTKQESEVIEKYNNVVNTVNTFEDRKIQVKILKAKINDKSTPFYPVISEEQIIIELDQLLKESNLKGGITFQPIISDSVEASKNEVNSLADSSLKKMVDQYNSALMIGGQNQQIKTENANDSDKAVVNNSNNTNQSQTSNTNTQKNSKEKKNTVQYLKCEVKFAGNYAAIDKFLNTIDKNEKKIIVNSIKISEDTLDSVKGTINLEFYSIPKINDDLESYLKWDLNHTYSKNMPFSKGSASGITEANKNNSDFVASVKSVNSDLPTIIMGKLNDSLRTTYVYADSNSEENVEMILTQNGNKYYYKYKTSKDTFPTDYNGAGVEFAPASPNIVLDILSENRVTSNDKSEIKLKIVNKTDKLVLVNITGDDKSNPRVTIEGDGSNISINQK